MQNQEIPYEGSQLQRERELRIKAMENNKPDWTILADQNSGFPDSFVKGCEHVWNTYVLERDAKIDRLESENKALQSSVRASERFRAEDAMAHMEEDNLLRAKLKESEHLKELADDAYLNLKKENEELKAKLVLKGPDINEIFGKSPKFHPPTT